MATEGWNLKQDIVGVPGSISAPAMMNLKMYPFRKIP